MELTGWVPIRLYWQDRRPWVDWCQLGDLRLTEPFFDHTIENCFQDPFHLLFRHQTPIEALAKVERAQQGSAPSGFIFHMSRCGSTLVAQMLSTFPSSNVVSEPSVLESVFRTESQPANVSDDQRVAWFRGLVSALGRPRGNIAEPFVVKFTSWNTTHLPLIQRAFPGVPWIFLYRDPVEVLVSLRRNSGGRLIPGAIDPALLGLDLPTVLQMKAEEYHACVLAGICNTAIECQRPGRTHFVSYQELPEIVWDLLPDFFGFACTAADQARMRDRARFSGKDPAADFRKDRDQKQRAATGAIRAAADRWLSECFEEMELQRHARGIQ